jgi:hypothetical protein
VPASILIRLGGLAAIVGGIVYAGGSLLLARGPLLGGEFFLYMNSFGSGFFAVLLPLGAMATIAALHVLQRERYGLPGALVSLISLVCLALAVGALIVGVTPNTISDCACMTVLGWSLLVATFSIPVLGSLTITARVLPRWCGVALIFGSPLIALLIAPLGGAAWALVGFAIFRAGAHQAQQPSRVRGRKAGNHDTY